jgi:hypothetical protein
MANGGDWALFVVTLPQEVLRLLAGSGAAHEALVQVQLHREAAVETADVKIGETVRPIDLASLSIDRIIGGAQRTSDRPRRGAPCQPDERCGGDLALMRSCATAGIGAFLRP